jgi:hypothetical protein
MPASRGPTVRRASHTVAPPAVASLAAERLVASAVAATCLAAVWFVAGCGGAVGAASMDAGASLHDGASNGDDAGATRADAAGADATSSGDAAQDAPATADAATDASPPPDASEDALDPRVPIYHRPSASACPQQRGRGDMVCPCTDGGCMCPGAACTKDSDCSMGTNGRCLESGGFGPPPAPICSYDGCFADTDCPAATPCDCRPSPQSNPANVCLTGSDCRVDSDCGPGGYCSPIHYGDWCGVEYHCHKAADTCVNDSDCDGGRCNFNATAGHWICGIGCGPPPP